MKQHNEFSYARAHGQSQGGKYLVLSTALDAAENSIDTTTIAKKIGIIVTKKVGNAVVRNRLRRQVHAIIAKNYMRIDPAVTTRYLVTIIRWRAPQATFEQLEADWLKQAKRLGILLSQ